jgi:RNA helicase HrpA
MNPHELPVYQQKDRILEALSKNQVIVVESPTGSGKTTQLPIILHEAGYAKYGLVGVTQPRRIAAISVSEFISKQLGTRVPGLVGYKMRFEDKTNEETAIKIMTDGILLQEMKLDPSLSRYSLIMVDEAHERSLNIDFILGLLKRVLESRPEFKVIVSSATINAEVFSEYFGECPVVKIETSMYPVTLVYDAPSAEAGEEALQLKIEEIVRRIVGERRDGDILVFLPGEKAIKDCMKRLAYGPVGNKLHLIPLYGRLGKDEQERVFETPPFGKTKVVVSTNIAETSLTIDGVTSVIDSGLSKLNHYNPRTFTSSLIETPISKASCNQRKGRAGRTRPGSCYRLYDRSDFENRPLFTTEEIYRTDLTEVVLRMAELGISDFERFEFISQPSKSGILGAVDALALLDALTPERDLTRVGRLMCAFPLLPRHSRMIVEAIERYPAVIEEVLIAASFLSTQSPYVLPPGEEMEARRAHHAFRDPAGDFVSYLRIFRGFGEAKDKAAFAQRNYLDERTLLEIHRVKEQIELIVSDLGVPIASGGPLDDYLVAVSRGLIQFVCVRQDRGLFRSLTADRIQIHPGSVMFRENPDFIVAGEIVRTSRMYAMSVSPIPRQLIGRISPRLEKLLPRGAVKERPARVRELEQPGERAGRGRREKVAVPRDLPRDFTNKIKIGGEVFDIRIEKKKKIVELAWSGLRSARERLDRESLALYKGMRGLVLVGHRRLLEGEKLDVILKIAPWLDPEADLSKTWPRNVNFLVSEEGDRLLDALSHVLQVAEWRKESPELGFVTLFTDGEGAYWFRVSRGFHTALNESLASLESLTDEVGEGSSKEGRERLSTLYRRLQSFFE